ncbi:SNF2-related protein [Lacticaseibacillus jixianensis]|uniref:SNF2-related protein n=1 Tax=Lacticaseibacillus jixianensis TaxID=2486012 RepID=A0ABW4B5P8_9LACO|nr:SNF2-related protein [Lacticaseibacillus jixianensis]
MARRKMPSIMWSRGEKIVRGGNVAITAIDQGQEIEATVYGTEPYTVILGEDAAEDYCSCPYFPGHGYCKHIAAVELYFRDQNKDVEAVIEAGDMPVRQEVFRWAPAKPRQQSSGQRFLQARAIEAAPLFHGPTSTAVPLALQVTLGVASVETASWALELRFFIELHIAAREGGGHFYVVSDLGRFFDAYEAEARFATNGKASYVLAHTAFAAPERALLDAMAQAYHAEGPKDRAVNNAAAARELILAPGSLAKQAGAFDQLAHFEFTPYRDRSFPQVIIAPFTPAAGLFQMTITQQREGFRVTLEADAGLIMPRDRMLLHEDHCYQLTAAQMQAIHQLVGEPQSAVSDLTSRQQLAFTTEETAAVRTLAQAFAKIGVVVGAALVAAPAMTPHFALDRELRTITLALSFDYAGNEVAAGAPLTLNQPRDTVKERQAREYLTSLGFKPSKTTWRLAVPDADTLYDFYQQLLPNLRENGSVTVSPSLAALVQDGKALAPQVAVSEQAGLLAISFSLKGVEAGEVDQMLNQIDVARPYLTRADGSLVIVDEPLRRVAKALTSLRHGPLHHGQALVPAAQTLAVQAALGPSADFADQVKHLAQDLTHPEQFKSDNPLAVAAQLRPYQVAGVQWLEMLNAHGFGGILADEMGLGKTLEMIAFLTHHLHAGQPSLIVAPASLLYNWQAECAKFAPALRVAVVDGTKAERTALIAASDYDILIASYNSVQRDAAEYAKRPLNYLVLDEAQFVKNSATKTHQSLRKLKPRATYALSGTPIENRTDELWAIFALVLPGLLPSKQVFAQMAPDEVALRVAPFILRREKKTVLKDLPPLVESNLTNEMTKAQKTVYLAQLEQMQVKVRGLSSQGLVKNKLAILAGLTRLRQLCDTPALYVDGYRGGSGKMDQLEDLVAEAAANGRRVLIFSQFTGMLARIESRMAELQLPHFLLEGATAPKQRLAMVDAFNAGERQFFLISLKAGSTGLNLTAADMVILVDLWWNPAVEDQAIARAHRIGQHHQVDVYRLITKGTIEEQIVRLQAQKRDLVDQILSGAENKAMLSDAEIRQILGISASEG